jgi:peptide/nickel transport system substrate-binding protein
MTQGKRIVRRNRPVVFAAAALLLITMSACGNAAHEDTSATIVQATTVSMPPATKDVDSIKVALTAGEPGSIDPINGYDFSSDTVISNLCEPLLRISSDGKLSPGLASEFKQVDSLTQVYTIRRGVNFWDGSPLTNVDAAYSLARTLDPAAPSHFLFTAVAAIEPTGTDDVTVKFTHPDELFYKEMANPFGAVVKKSYAERVGKDLGTSTGGLMCTGPFKLDKWTPGTGITLVRNDGYWDPAFRARAARVELPFVTDTTAIAQGLLSGELDVAYEIAPTLIPRLQSANSGTLIFGPSTQSLDLVFLNPDGPLKDSALREALSLAIDRQALAKTIYHDAATPNYTMIPSNTWDPEGKTVYEAAYPEYEKANGLDIEKAKSLVKASSYKGEPIALASVAGDASMVDIAQFVQQQADLIGLKVQVNTMQPLNYSNLFNDKDVRKGLDVTVTTFFSQAQDPLETLSSVVLPDQTYNYFGYDNPAVAAKLRQAAATADPIERSKLVVDAQAIYEPDRLHLALLNLNTVTFVNKRLTGATTSMNYLFQPSLALIGGK